MLRWAGATDTAEVDAVVERISEEGGTPLVVAQARTRRRRGRGARRHQALRRGQAGHATRFAELRAMGIRTVMITGDDRARPKAIAA